MLNLLFNNPEQVHYLNTINDWVFVLVTSILLIILVNRESKNQARVEKELEVVAELSNHILGIDEINQLVQSILSFIDNIFHTKRAFIAINHSEQKNIKFFILEHQQTKISGLYFDKTEPFIGLLLNQHQITSNSKNKPDSQPYPLRLVKSYPAFVLVPLTAQGKTIGVIGFARQDELRLSEIHIIKAISVVIAQQLHSAELLQKNKIQIERLSLLRKTDEMILNDHDPQSLFNQLIHAASEIYRFMAIYYLDQETNQIQIFRSKNLNNEKTILFSGYTEYYKLIQTPLFINNYFNEINVLRNMPPDHPLRSGKFSGFAVCPLFIKENHIGLVEVFFPEELIWSEDEKEFLTGLCNQIAIALDNVNHLANLKKSNQHLLHAYEQTLEGWSHALELRDRETEDHTKRAIKYTMKMAQLLGIPEKQHIHIRRGALLHDIGKLGVPDNILHKPGPLNIEEWKIMREHPVYAQKLLKEITYLHPALNIPYCHHEKWDGSGYPQGLKGDEIPLEARIFAIVDVFDALTSDRPYRKALSIEEALSYLKQQSGTHFDPRVVDAFVRLIADNKNQAD